MVNPSKSRSRQRLYRKNDVEMILKIKKLLYEDRFTINGARKKLKELGFGKPYAQSEVQFEKKGKNVLIQEIIQELKEIQRLLNLSRP
jgi:DNA-binding transcriptional MerR regulator